MAVKNFEDLVAWQKARVLARRIYEVSQQGRLGRDTGLARQMQRAGVSIMSNIAEGHERSNPGDFHRFLAIAKGSCAELRAQLYLAHDIGHISESDFSELRQSSMEVGRIIGGLMASVKIKRQGQPGDSKQN
jgi:four helix bundle protein